MRVIWFDSIKTKQWYVNAMKIVTSITKWQDDYSTLRQWSSNMKLIVVANRNWLRRILTNFMIFWEL